MAVVIERLGKVSYDLTGWTDADSNGSSLLSLLPYRLLFLRFILVIVVPMLFSWQFFHTSCFGRLALIVFFLFLSLLILVFPLLDLIVCLLFLSLFLFLLFF